MNETLVDLLLFLAAIMIILVVAIITKNKNTVPISIKNNYNFTNKMPTEIETVFDNVVVFLQNDDVYFRYGKNKVEKDYQQDLEGRLAVLKERHGYNVKYEAKIGKYRVDFVIENKVGIEMKVYKGGTQVEKELFYQITKYGKLYQKMIGFIINESEKDNQELKEEIELRLLDQNVLKKKTIVSLLNLFNALFTKVVVLIISAFYHDSTLNLSRLNYHFTTYIIY